MAAKSSSCYIIDMRKFFSFITIALFVAGCSHSLSPANFKDFEGLIITEVAANADKIQTDSWVEILNTTSREIQLNGLSIYLFDDEYKGEEITILDETVVGPYSRLVLSTADYTLLKGISSDSDFEIVLGMSADKNIVDRFSRDRDASPVATPKYGSYQRIPERGGEWVVTGQATRRIENYDADPNGIWVWSTHMDQWIADDFAVLRKMKQMGYDHILLNYNSFDDPTKAGKALEIIEVAKEIGVKVHAWMQVFCENKVWINPIEDIGFGEGRYKQEEFDRIIAKANRYIDDFDVDGLHLDYIRFSGSGKNMAANNNYNNGVTASGAINEFCRQLRESLDSRPEGVMVSAAMMTGGDVLHYYGQDPEQMGKYIDVFMPMVYKYYTNYSYNDAWMRSTCATFTGASKAQVWAGIQTYKYQSGVSGEIGMTPEEVLADATVIKNTDCSGVVLFRYALGSYPDLSTLWDNAN